MKYEVIIHFGVYGCPLGPGQDLDVAINRIDASTRGPCLASPLSEVVFIDLA
jgi:hypothetical protein